MKLHTIVWNTCGYAAVKLYFIWWKVYTCYWKIFKGITFWGHTVFLFGPKSLNSAVAHQKNTPSLIVTQPHTAAPLTLVSPGAVTDGVTLFKKNW